MPVKPTTLIFDLGGTLIANPFAEAFDRIKDQLSEITPGALGSEEIVRFLDAWKLVDRNLSFPFASHFLQEEQFIAVAAWRSFQSTHRLKSGDYLHWQATVLDRYRREALRVVAQQEGLPAVRGALSAAKRRGYRLAVGSNDRCWAPGAMLEAAGLLEYFDHVASSEALSFAAPGAEKPTATFFRQLEVEMAIQFTKSHTYYVGDDEVRDIRSVTDLPLTPVRYFGGTPQSTSWLDTPPETVAPHSFSHFDEFHAMIERGVFDPGGGYE